MQRAIHSMSFCGNTSLSLRRDIQGGRAEPFRVAVCSCSCLATNCIPAVIFPSYVTFLKMYDPQGLRKSKSRQIVLILSVRRLGFIAQCGRAWEYKVFSWLLFLQLPQNNLQNKSYFVICIPYLCPRVLLLFFFCHTKHSVLYFSLLLLRNGRCPHIHRSTHATALSFAAHAQADG